MRKEQRASARQRGYDSRWDRARADFLAQPENAVCVKCRARGLLNGGHLHKDGAPETNPRRMGLVVDHIIPHRGDRKLFWDRKNWQPLCHDDHDITKQQEEVRGFNDDVDADGWFADPKHPANRKA